MGRAKLSHQLPAIKWFYKRVILLKRGDANTASKALLNERLFWSPIYQKENHEKLIALLLSVLLALTSMAPAYAAKPYLENQNFSIEASIDELADGITFAIIQEADAHLPYKR